MKGLKIAIICLVLLFVIVTTFVKMPQLLNNIVYGFMAVFALLFLVIKRKDLQIEDVFVKENDKEDTKKEA